MRLALISDVHANLEALKAVIDNIKASAEVDKILFLGDAVGYGPNPNETLKIINNECETCIMGNHDYLALGRMDGSTFNPYAKLSMTFTLSVLSDTSLELVSTFKTSHETDLMMLVHSTPHQPEDWHYCLSAERAGYEFGYFSAPICFIGHTHIATIFTQNKASEVSEQRLDDFNLDGETRYIINVGSVGQPRDGDPRAGYCIFDTEQQRVEYKRALYDVQETQRKMVKANLPGFLIKRLSCGR